MKGEELIFTDIFRSKMGPLEWLQYIADSFLGLASLWEDHDSHYLEDELEFYREEFPNTSKIDVYAEIARSIGERPLHDYYLESLSMIREVEDCRECLMRAFEGSAVFPNIIDALGTIEYVLNAAESAQDDFYYNLHYSIVGSPEEAEELFGWKPGKRVR